MIEPYPLQWPESWPRTKYPERSAFQTTGGRARRHMLDQLRMLGATDVVVTTNVAIRRDGLPYANQRGVTDPGVSVWFVVGNERRVIPCDRWNTIDDNIRAIGLTVEALRGLERWGAREIVDRAFAGFAALPAGGNGSAAPWWDVLGLASDATPGEITTAYRRLLREAHPDVGGDHERFLAVKEAYVQANEAVAAGQTG